MAGKSKPHLVDGEYITVQQAADRLGVTRDQIYALINHHRCSLQTAVWMIRENLALGQGRAARYMIDGKWITVRQMAERLGITVNALRSYMYGNHATLAKAAQAYRENAVKHGGKKYVVHRVNGKAMTTLDVAKNVGISVGAVRSHMHKHRCSLASTVRYYDRKRREKAEKDILSILGF